MKKTFKIYYIVNYLLERFEGICSMFAEEELVEEVYIFVTSGNEKRLLEYIDFTFGLNKRCLTGAIKSFNNYQKEKKEIGL